MPNPLQSFIERCPLCIDRYDMGEFLEHGVGRLFVVCFGCNRKHCTSAKPGTYPRYTPCQFSMECTCDDNLSGKSQCYECKPDESSESMLWFDHVRLVLAGFHYLMACIVSIFRAGVEMTVISTVGIMCACINSIPGLPVLINANERAQNRGLIKLIRLWINKSFNSLKSTRMITPQALMKQLCIEIIFLYTFVITMHASVVSLINSMFISKWHTLHVPYYDIP